MEGRGFLPSAYYGSRYYSKRELREERNWTSGMIILSLLPECDEDHFLFDGVRWLYRKDIVHEVEQLPEFQKMMDERLDVQLTTQFRSPAVLLKRFDENSYAREKLKDFLTPGEMDRLMNYSFMLGDKIKPKSIRR